MSSVIHNYCSGSCKLWFAPSLPPPFVRIGLRVNAYTRPPTVKFDNLIGAAVSQPLLVVPVGHLAYWSAEWGLLSVLARLAPKADWRVLPFRHQS